MAAVFAMQGTGILCAAAVGVIVAVIFKTYHPVRCRHEIITRSDGPFKLTRVSAFQDKGYGSSVAAIRASCPPQADYIWRSALHAPCFVPPWR